LQEGSSGSARPAAREVRSRTAWHATGGRLRRRHTGSRGQPDVRYLSRTITLEVTLRQCCQHCSDRSTQRAQRDRRAEISKGSTSG